MKWYRNPGLSGRFPRALLWLFVALTLCGCSSTGGRTLSREKFSSTVGEYLAKPGHKALALNLTTYRSMSVWGRDTRSAAISDALEECEKTSGGGCELVYANSDEIYDVSDRYSGGTSTFGSTLGQAVGLFAAYAGALGGDTQLSNQGLDMFAKSSGVPSSGPTPSSPGGPLSSGRSGGGTAVAGTDLKAVADRCAQIAQSRFPADAQNVLAQRSACIYYCAYNITGDRGYFERYTKAQASANTLCSYNLGNRCNDIRPISQCNYR